MGSPSYYVDEELEVQDTLELLNIHDKYKDDLYNLVNERGQVDFGNWDDLKLYSYWYDTTKEILNDLAPFLKGYVEFDFDHEHHFRIVFENDTWCVLVEERKVDWTKATKIFNGEEK